MPARRTACDLIRPRLHLSLSRRAGPCDAVLAAPLKRECTPVEKGDLIAWLLTVDGEAQYPAGRATGPVRAEE